ncbi:MAG: NnrS family protein [Rhodocyclaceae bacterium]|nr:NnrS family protein [Rhodocyclaceae bacterium]MBK6907535.1 NnrS family protein [Rhodocyclaceae bacterium]
MNFSQPLWLVGFRSLFALACIAGAVLPLLWLWRYTSAVLPAPTWGIAWASSPLIWHAHEMLFGFGGAVLAGFLLTASKNWVAIRGYHGGALAALSAAWLLDRLAQVAGGYLPWPLYGLLSSLFVGAFVAMVLATLIRHRANDNFRVDNRYFILALPLLLPAKWLLLQPEHFSAGVTMTLALFRLAFLLMLERTLTQFIGAAFKTPPRHRPVREHVTKSVALVLVAAPWLPAWLGAGLSFLCASLLLWRWLESHLRQALSRIDIGIMLLGQGAIIAHLFLQGALAIGVGVAQTLAAVQVHLFTVGALGLIVPAMLVRISKGHTGRKVQFDRLDKAVLWLMLAALVLRVGLPVVAPASTLVWLWASAIAWLLAFGTLALRYIPWLLAARADGRAH